MSWGEEFADSFNIRFFAKTFPTLFLVRNGGPRQAEKSITDLVEGVEAVWSLMSS